MEKWINSPGCGLLAWFNIDADKKTRAAQTSGLPLSSISVCSPKSRAISKRDRGTIVIGSPGHPPSCEPVLSKGCWRFHHCRGPYACGLEFFEKPCPCHRSPQPPEHWFSTSVPQEFIKHALLDYLVRGADLFSLRLSNKKMTTAKTTIDVWCEWIKIIPIFCQMGKKYV